jgi:exodeoxyribonuclease-3
MDKGNWHDGVRLAIPDGKLYSWWSYRARDWAAANRGRRLDHIWVTPPLLDQIIGAEVITTARGWEKPSDHAPVVLRLDE